MDFKRNKNKNKKPPSNNKGGGQKGHKGHFRQLLHINEVDTVLTCKLPNHCACGGAITLKNGHQRHQVHELPEIKLHVTEYCLEKGACSSCGNSHIANLPAGITWGITGPRLTGLMSHLVSRYQLSRRELKEFLQEQFQFNISLGTIFNKQKIVNAVLEAPVAELLEAVKQSPSINADETGHNRDGKKQWMWGFVSSTIAYFSIQNSRGKKVLKSLLGDFKNIVISDRYAAYNYFDSSSRQMCWAHLKRDFTKLSEKDNKIVSRIGKNLLSSETKLFEIWHQFKQNHITRDELLRKAAPIRKSIGELLEQGLYTDPTLRIVRFCKNLLCNFDAMWTFLSTDNVEPTNNHAERSLRHSVIWRKKYFGTRSEYGSEFVARSCSINKTCRLQAKNPFTFLSQSIENYFLKIEPPSLVMA
ncbi:MAG: IS66 family transposase [Gammaproteobacteria bacterium]|nr:IS66 family transposase [Gammaproteobacteria bacterium]